MLDQGRISSVQLLLLLIMIEGATSFLLGPAAATQISGRDSWLATSIIASAFGLAVVLVCIALGKRFPNQTFTEYLSKILGKIPGKILAAAYTLVFIHYVSVILNEGTAFIHIAFLRETPLLALDLIGAAAAIYGVYLGIEVIARQNEIVLPIWIFSLLLVTVLVMKEVNFNNLRPFLENGIMPVIEGGAVMSPYRGELFVLLMLFPYLNKKKEAFKAAGTHLIFITILAALTTAVLVVVFGDMLTTRLVFPFYTLAMYISVAQFLERLQILIVIMWMAGVVIKMAVFYHCAGIAAATTLGLKNYRKTLLPIAIASVIISQKFYGTSVVLSEFLFKIWPYYGSIVELLIPLLVLTIAVIGKKGGNNDAGQNQTNP